MAQAFRFRLETLLRVRELREREAKRRLGAKLADIARLDRLNEQTGLEILERQAALLKTQRCAGLDPNDLLRGRAWVAHLRRTVHERQVLRTTLVAESERLREELKLARVQTRTLEKLKLRRFDDYRRERGRREQADADELAQQLHAFGIGEAALKASACDEAHRPPE